MSRCEVVPSGSCKFFAAGEENVHLSCSYSYHYTVYGPLYNSPAYGLADGWAVSYGQVVLSVSHRLMSSKGGHQPPLATVLTYWA